MTTLSLLVHRLGNVETRPSFHDDTHIWPVGYRVRQQMGWRTMLHCHCPFAEVYMPQRRGQSTYSFQSKHSGRDQHRPVQLPCFGEAFMRVIAYEHAHSIAIMGYLAR